MREVFQLRKRVEELEALVDALRPKKAAGSDLRFFKLGLTAQEANVFAVLYDASPRIVHNDILSRRVGLYKGLENMVSPEKTMRVVIYKIRRKLENHGIRIFCQHGLGMYLSELDKARVKQVIDGA